MMWIPFISLAIGITLGIKIHTLKFLKGAEHITNIALILLMLTIGGNMGLDKDLMGNLGKIGFHCVVMAFLAIAFSAFFMVIAEKTVIPLEKFREKLLLSNPQNHMEIEGDRIGKEVATEKREHMSPLIWMMPVSIGVGILFGLFLLPENFQAVLGYSLTTSLIVLYIGVGIGLAANLNVLEYLKIIGCRLLVIPVAILVGSILAGLVSGFILKLPLYISVMSVGGMSYYSITGAYMTQLYGIEAGTYGFIVNVFREMLTILLLPLLMKVSKGSTIASGAAGCMDTMLVPITKFVGAELGLIALITGTMLTFLVPFLLPILSNFF